MDRRVLKYNVAAALFSAAFLFSNVTVSANTYDNFNLSYGYTELLNFDFTPKLKYENSDLIINNTSRITYSSVVVDVLNPKSNYYYVSGLSLLASDDGNELQEKNSASHDQYYEERYNSHSTQKYNTEDLNTFTTVTKSWIRNVPDNMSYKMYLDYCNIISDPYKISFSTGKTAEEIKDGIKKFNEKYKTNLTIELDGTGSGLLYSGDEYKCMTAVGWDQINGLTNFSNNTYFTHTGYRDNYYKTESREGNTITYLDYSHRALKRNLSVTNNSIFEIIGIIIDGNTIQVQNNSSLRCIRGLKDDDASLLQCENLNTDGDIVITDMGYTNEIDENKNLFKIIYNHKFLASDAVCAEKIIVNNSICSNNIKTDGSVKGHALKVAAINATSASITGNQSICGVFTTTGQAKLNGGVTLGNKKISGVSAGTLSATSMEAVNGMQLNTIKQKIASFGGKTYSAGSDIAISTGNAISVAKSGVVNKGNTGIVTGGTVYKITNALNQSLDSLKASVSSHQSTLTTLSQGLSDLKSSVTNINSSVASATKNLSAQLNNRLQSDMGNLSDDGKNVIRNMVSSTLKSMNSMSVKDTTLSPMATYESKENASNTELDTIRSSLDAKADKDDLSSLSSSVASNSKQVEDNSQAIQKNVSAISDMQLSKADADGSNISVDGYSEKLGTGKVESGNHELINGNTVYDALSKKADIGYVDSGLGMVSSQLDAMSQGLTQDMNRVGAGAAALAGLHPTSYDASDKFSFAYGGGHYKNANTSALGAFYHPNERTMVSVAGTIGNNDVMLSAGVSIKVGIGDSVSKVIVTPKMFSAQEVTNQNMKDHLDTQSERLQQIESTLQSRISE